MDDKKSESNRFAALNKYVGTSKTYHVASNPGTSIRSFSSSHYAGSSSSYGSGPSPFILSSSMSSRSSSSSSRSSSSSSIKSPPFMPTSFTSSSRSFAPAFSSSDVTGVSSPSYLEREFYNSLPRGMQTFQDVLSSNLPASVKIGALKNIDLSSSNGDVANKSTMELKRSYIIENIMVDPNEKYCHLLTQERSKVPTLVEDKSIRIEDLHFVMPECLEGIDLKKVGMEALGLGVSLANGGITGAAKSFATKNITGLVVDATCKLKRDEPPFPVDDAEVKYVEAYNKGGVDELVKVVEKETGKHIDKACFSKVQIDSAIKDAGSATSVAIGSVAAAISGKSDTATMSKTANNMCSKSDDVKKHNDEVFRHNLNTMVGIATRTPDKDKRNELFNRCLREKYNAFSSNSDETVLAKFEPEDREYAKIVLNRLNKNEIEHDQSFGLFDF